MEFILLASVSHTLKEATVIFKKPIVTVPGTYRFKIGASSKDIRHEADVRINKRIERKVLAKIDSSK